MGATVLRFFLRHSFRISIHAPAMGATERGSDNVDEYIHFNPRSRDGSDKITPDAIQKTVISIHAPAMGAT